MSRGNNGCFTSVLCWIHDLVPLPCTYTKNAPVEDMKQFLSESTRVCYATQPFFVSSQWRILRSRRLELVSARKNGRARGRHACLPLTRPFFLALTASKRLLRRLPTILLPCFGEERCVILPLWRGAFRDGRNRELLYSSRPLIDNNDFNQVGVQRLKWKQGFGWGA